MGTLRRCIMRCAIIFSLELALLAGVGGFLETQPLFAAQAQTFPQAKGVKGLPAQVTPGQPGYYGYTQAPWFAAPGAQKHLNFTVEQQNVMNKVYGDNWNKYSQGIQGLGNVGGQQR